MSLSPTTAASSGLFGWIAAALALVGALLLSAGIWFGLEWAEGRDALDQKTDLERQVTQLSAAAKVMQQQSATATADYRRATQRLNHIADMQERDLEQQRRFDLQQRQALDAILSRRPDLRTGHAGPDVLQYWNDANAGPVASPAAAAAGHAGSAGATVPRAAIGNERPVGQPADQPRGGDKPLPPVQGQQKQPDPGRPGLAGDRLGLVLRVGAVDAGPGGRVQQ